MKDDCEPIEYTGELVSVDAEESEKTDFVVEVEEEEEGSKITISVED